MSSGRWGVDFDGMAEMMAEIRQHGPDGEANLRAAIRESSGFAHRTLVDATPGSQKREWDLRHLGPLASEVTTNSKVMWFLEWGTGLYTEAADGKRAKYKIAPKFKKALAFQGEGGSYVAARGADGQVMRNAKGNMLFRTKKGGVGVARYQRGADGTLDATNLAKMVARKYVMHPGIKPVRMVRNNLPVFAEDFQKRAEIALDKTLRGETNA